MLPVVGTTTGSSPAFGATAPGTVIPRSRLDAEKNCSRVIVPSSAFIESKAVGSNLSPQYAWVKSRSILSGTFSTLALPPMISARNSRASALASGDYELRLAFDAIDADRSGALNRTELARGGFETFVNSFQTSPTSQKPFLTRVL